MKNQNSSSIVFISLIILLCLNAGRSYSQKVFSVKYASQAEVKIFVVDYLSQADLAVFKVPYQSQALQERLGWSLR